jgi:superfamily II DNA or RNA helicase
MKEVFKLASQQKAENLIGIALGNGFLIPDNTTRRRFAREVKLHSSKPADPFADQSKIMSDFFNSFLEVERIRNEFVRQLKQIISNPKTYGIERDWRLTQKEALEAIVVSIEGWTTRPLVEIPTGVGKSMIWGGIMRAFYDTLRIFGLDNQIELVLLTSRINIADQMVAKKTHVDQVAKQYESDNALDYGDIKQWFSKLSDKNIRILAGNSQSKIEVEKNSVITLMCYQSLRPKNVARFFNKKIGLVICDESHRVTDNIRMCLENQMHTAFFIGGSATTKGPRYSQPFKFFESQANTLDAPYIDHLAYYGNIIKCGYRGELKKIRYIHAQASIDLSSLVSRSRLELPQKQLESFISKNIPTMQYILEEVFLGEHPVLTVVGSKRPIDRKWLVFVDRVETAERLANFCNHILHLKIKEKYGDQQLFVADYVSGKMSREEFNHRFQKFEAGITNIMFNAEKLGEGADLPNINGVLSYRAYTEDSLWKLIQELGRGVRFIPNEDLLYVSGIFKSQNHNIASAFGVFGVDEYISGGLVVGLKGEREAEIKSFKILKEGKTWKDVWSELNEEERQLAPFVNIHAVATGQHSIKPSAAIDSNVSAVMSLPIEKSLASNIRFVEDQNLKIQYLLQDKVVLIDYVTRELKKKGVVTTEDLINLGHKDYINNFKFSAIGKMPHVCSLVIGNRNENVSKYRLLELARHLGWEIPQELDITPDWKTPRSIYTMSRDRKLLIGPEVILKFVEKYRTTNPDWFKKFPATKNAKAEHFHPDLVKIIESDLFADAKPDDYESWSEMCRVYVTTRKQLEVLFEKYRPSHPNWCKEFKRQGAQVKCYHKDFIVEIESIFTKRDARKK